MAEPEGQDIGLVTIKEAARQTGLPASTIRFYDQQFADFLAVKRGTGRRRLFTPEAVQRLLEIQRLLKDEGLSMRQTRQALAKQAGMAETADETAAAEGPRSQAVRAEVRTLEKRLKDLREIQERTLALVGSLTRG